LVEVIEMNAAHLLAFCLIAMSIVICGECVCSTATINCCEKSYRDFPIEYYSVTPGNTFLIVYLEIHYTGEDIFSVDPSFFSANIDGIKYESSVATTSLESIDFASLRYSSLTDGDSVRGNITYEVPASSKGKSFETLTLTNWGIH
jgi:hypothetical protein